MGAKFVTFPYFRQARPKNMVPVPLPPFSHSYTVRAGTPSPHKPPPSSTPSITTILLPIHRHHPPPCRSAYQDRVTTARDGHFSSTAMDQEPCIMSSRFISTVVLFAGAAHTTFSSTAMGLIPRCARLPSQICFITTDSHRTPDAYTVPQERWYFISPQIFDLN